MYTRFERERTRARTPEEAKKESRRVWELNERAGTTGGTFKATYLDNLNHAQLANYCAEE